MSGAATRVVGHIDKPMFDTTARRIRLVVICALLASWSFFPASGKTYADTKLDLLVNPWGFMGRALTLWDDQGFFGQLQNQAYGYFFPMGPFFGIGHTLGVPSWVTLATWHAVLYCVAFLGTYGVARTLLRLPFWSSVGAGLAYALSARMLTFMGMVSSEITPMAFAPLIVLPLILGAREGYSPRRAGLLSGLAVLMCGGINATATIAALILPGMWVVTRRPGKRQLVLIGWWVLGIVLATLWWVGPLLVLGQYSPPFLDWIESASGTTSVTTSLETFRGTSQWAAYWQDGLGPQWPTGHQLATQPGYVIATTAVAMIGLLGLMTTKKHRAFLLVSALIGFALVRMGHYVGNEGASWFQAAWTTDLRAALDGSLKALRNVHKFDPVMRLPLALGFGAAMARLSRVNLLQWRKDLVIRQAAATAALGALFVSTFTFWSGETEGRAPFTDIPAAWTDVAHYLDEAKSTRSLVVPGAPFGMYVWGFAKDEPLQSTAKTPWAVRDVVPLSSAGNIRLLDGIERQLATGRGSNGLADLLARAGIDHIVVRNDLHWEVSNSPRSLLVRQALAASPNIDFQKGFGPATTIDRYMVSSEKVGTVQQVEVWDVNIDAPNVDAKSVNDSLVFTGGPEGLVSAAETGALKGRTAVMAGQDNAVRDLSNQMYGMVTDTYRRAEHQFSRVHRADSQTLGADTPFRQDRPVVDYNLFDKQDDAKYRTTEEIRGVKSVTASSSGSDADAFLVKSRSAHPYSALDGSQETAWQSSGTDGWSGQWWQVDFGKPVELDHVTLTYPNWLPVRQRPASVEISSDLEPNGVRITLPDQTDTSPRIDLTPGKRSWLKITALRPHGMTYATDSFVLSEVQIEGVTAQRFLRTPAATPDVGSGSTNIGFTADSIGNAGCVNSGGQPVCGPGMGEMGEEPTAMNRIFTIDRGGEYTIGAFVAAFPNVDLSKLVLGKELRVRTSTNAIDHPWSGAIALVDKNPKSIWFPSRYDPAPAFTISLPKKTAIDRIVLDQSTTGSTGRVTQVALQINGESTVQTPQEDGTIELPKAVKTQEVSVTLLRATADSSLPDQGLPSDNVRPRIAEVYLYDGDDAVSVASKPLEGIVLECGDGPYMLIDGKRIDFKFQQMTDLVLTGYVTKLTPCDDTLALDAGEHTLEFPTQHGLAPASVQLIDNTFAAAGEVSPGRRVRIQDWGPSSRTINVGEGETAALLRIAENFNKGWVAELNGQKLEPVTLDGWQQGFVIPAGKSGDIQLNFTPTGPYRMLLIFGGLCVAGLGAALWLTRRTTAGSDLPSHDSAVHRVVSGAVALAAAYCGLGLAGAFLMLAALALGALHTVLANRDAIVLERVVLSISVLSVIGLVAIVSWGLLQDNPPLSHLDGRPWGEFAIAAGLITVVGFGAIARTEE